MARFPREPDLSTLKRIGPEPHVLAKGTRLWRIYSRDGRHPSEWNEFRHFGPVDGNRFDHHQPPPRTQARGIMYVAENGATCFAERFQEGGSVDIARDEMWLVGFSVTREITLHNLRGLWPTRAGASTAIHSGRRDYARNWSRAIYETYGSGIEGLYYSSSMHGGRPSLALYERCKDAVPKDPDFHRALSDPGVLNIIKNAARAVGYDVVDGKDVIWSPFPRR